MYKTCNFDYDCCLKTVLIPHSNIHHHNTRNKQNIQLPFFHKTNSQFSLRYVGSKLWNSLPDDVTKSESLNIFKKKLRLHLSLEY